jgi:hypothetical protein
LYGAGTPHGTFPRNSGNRADHPYPRAGDLSNSSTARLLNAGVTSAQPSAMS